MVNSASSLAYPDVKEAFDRAMLRDKGVKIPFKDPKAAHRFLSRCNSFRVLNRKENKEIYDPGHSLHGRSPYDTLSISRKGSIVIIEPIGTLDYEIIDL